MDAPSRQSGILSLINREGNDRISTSRAYTSEPSMASSTVVSPTSMYSNGLPPPYNWSTPQSTSGLVSPPESRRTSDNKADAQPPIQTALPPPRQSLPSIREALNTKPPDSYASPVSASLPLAHHPGPYSQGPIIPRSYPPPDHPQYSTHIPTSQPRQSSPPRIFHAQANPFARTEPPPNNFPAAARHPSSSYPGPPPQSQHPGGRYEPTRYDTDGRGIERPQHPAHQPHHPQPGPYTYPPGSNQISQPHEPHEPHYSQGRYPPRDDRDIEEGCKSGAQDDRGVTHFKPGLKRRFEAWEFENCLSSISVSSNALQTWSNHFYTIAQEQQSNNRNGVPDRMPSLDQCNEMLQNQDKIRVYLEKMRDMISEQHEHARMDQHLRDHGGKGPAYGYDEEMSMYSDDQKNQGYGGPESKKRRGRAAPPGRCHSCNRAETPEWRRGPDGARTLCNACGLHYAKLTRKNTMKQSQGSNGSSLRPKSMDDVSPRPL